MMVLEKIRKKLKPYRSMGLSESELEYLAVKYMGREHWGMQRNKFDLVKSFCLKG